METIENTKMTFDSSFAKLVTQKVRTHLLVLDDSHIVDLYRLVLEEIEAPLYKAVMDFCRYNQCRAATILGVSRGTLRSKLQYYFGERYVGTRT